MDAADKIIQTAELLGLQLAVLTDNDGRMCYVVLMHMMAQYISAQSPENRKALLARLPGDIIDHPLMDADITH